MNSTFMNSAMVFSQGIFFTLMILGLAAALPVAMAPGLIANGVPPAVAQAISHKPPVSILFATFLGYNPLRELLGPHLLATLPAHSVNLLTGREFFPNLIAAPFKSGLHQVFGFSIVICLIAALASWSRGKRQVTGPEPEVAPVRTTAAVADGRIAGASALESE